jgi:hypothetical protein
MAFPNFFIVGAPKAGTTALHAALAPHPGLYLSPVKEPKFFLCDGRPPEAPKGPGDAHSVREWVWRQDRYEALFAAAPPGSLRGESTPFYLYDRRAQERIRKAVPDAKLIAVLRDPVDRAHSNWMHLWSDGLEPIGEFMAACDAEEERVRRGWAPFWHYRRVGRYGEQLAHLYSLFPAEHIHVLRYRDLVESPRLTLDRVCAFLGVEPGVVTGVEPENVRPFAPPSWRHDVLSAVRRASRPLLWALHRGGVPRPALSVADRRRLLDGFAEDVTLLERLTGESYEDWLADEGRGEFASRRRDAGNPPGR